jgi:hypothetical protein
MATGRLTDIIKARRESGKGIASSLAGGFSERLKEKFDPRNVFNQDGLLTSLFPKLKAYKSKDVASKTDETSATGTKPGIASNSADSLKPLFLSIEKSTKTIAKNNASLSLIQRDTNLMKQTLSKIVKILSGRKKETKVVPKKTEPTQITGVPQAEEEDDKGGILGIIDKIKSLIGRVVDFIKNIIATFVKRFLPILRTIATLATRFLPLLASWPVLIAAIAALGTFALFKLSKFLSTKVAEKVPSMKILSPQQAATLLTHPENDIIALASDAAGRTANGGKPANKRFTKEEAVAYLKDQVENGKKYAENGLKLVDEKNKLEKVLKGTPAEIAAAGGKENIQKQISKLEQQIMDLGGETKLKEILAEDAVDPKTIPTQSNSPMGYEVPKNIIGAIQGDPQPAPGQPGTGSKGNKDQRDYKNRSVGFGDAEAAKLVDDGKIGKGGVEASAKSPKAVLKLIEDYKKDNNNDPKILRDKTVFLGTGFEKSDGSPDFDTVLKQISTLKSMGASDNAIKILGVSEASKNATEINSGLQNIAKNNRNEYIPVEKQKLKQTSISETTSADVDDEELGKAIANSLNTAPTPAPSPVASDDTGSFQAADAAASYAGATSPIPMSEQDTYTANNTGSADSNLSLDEDNYPATLPDTQNDVAQLLPKPVIDKAKELTPVAGDDTGAFQAADAAASQTPQTQENGNPEPIKQNKLPIDDPYNDQHPQFSSLIKKLANEYGVPA